MVFGAVLLFFCVVQGLAGLALALQFSTGSSWESANMGMAVGYLGALKNIHAGFPVLIFTVMYIHVAKGLVNSVGAGQSAVMSSGVIILVSAYANAFLGYAMVFGDMGYWATTVIFQLLSFAPGAVESLFGNYTLDAAVVTKLFTLHYLIGLAQGAMMLGHILVLHNVGSLNTTGAAKEVAFVDVLGKDAVAVLGAATVAGMLVLGCSVLLVEGVNCSLPSTSTTPAHIVPEIYLLPIYGALKVSTAKSVGLLVSLMILAVLAKS